jgi:hypothetical protein
VDQGVPEVGVRAMRLVGQLAQLGVAFALCQRDRVSQCLFGARRLLVLGFGHGCRAVPVSVGTQCIVSR